MRARTIVRTRIFLKKLPFCIFTHMCPRTVVRGHICFGGQRCFALLRMKRNVVRTALRPERDGITTPATAFPASSVVEITILG